MYGFMKVWLANILRDTKKRESKENKKKDIFSIRQYSYSFGSNSRDFLQTPGEVTWEAPMFIEAIYGRLLSRTRS